MRQWIYVLHPPREDFIATITDGERAIMNDRHFPYLEGLFEAGTLILAGPCLTPPNDGIAIIAAASEEEARAIMAADPAVSSGLMRAELREMRVTFLRDSVAGD